MDNKLLIGWKEIAAYISCSKVTAIRIANKGLPVFRVGGSVRAYTDDIDNWVASQRRNAVPKPGSSPAAAVVIDRADLATAFAHFPHAAPHHKFAVVALGVNPADYERVAYRLRVTAGRYERLMADYEVWTWELDRDGVFSDSNDVVRVLLGYGAAEILGYRPGEFLVAPDDRRAFENALETLTRTKDTVHRFRCRFLRRDSDVRMLETRAEIFYGPDGEPRGVWGASRGVTGVSCY